MSSLKLDQRICCELRVTLSGSIVIFQIDPLVEISQQLKSMARVKEFDNAVSLIEHLQSAMPQLLDEVSVFLRQPEPAES